MLIDRDSLTFAVKLDGLEMLGVLTCKKCGRITKFRGRELAKGFKLSCPCSSVSVELEGDDMSKVQEGLDELKATFKKLGTIKLGG